MNNRYVRTEVGVASCSQTEEDGLSCTAFHTAMQLIDVHAQESFMILVIFFLSFFQDLKIDSAMDTLSNEIEKRIMSSGEHNFSSR